MGGIADALAGALRQYGGTIRTEAPVTQFLIRNGEVRGVVLASGEEILANCVLSCLDARVTFLRLTPPGQLPDDFRSRIEQLDYTSMTVKINVKLNAPPDFKALPSGGRIGPQHHGTMHLCPTLETMERGYAEARLGRPATVPMLECTLPTAVDESLTPPGIHLMGMFVQYAPYQLAEGTWDANSKARFAQRCFAVMEEYAPGFTSSVIDYQVLTPVDLEQTFGLTGGNIMQGAMHLNSLYVMRPLAGYAQYATPISGLYLCGAAAHPGGGVMGAAGRNAARAVLRNRSL